MFVCFYSHELLPEFERCIAKLGMGTQWVIEIIVGYIYNSRLYMYNRLYIYNSRLYYIYIIVGYICIIGCIYIYITVGCIIYNCRLYIYKL